MDEPCNILAAAPSAPDLLLDLLIAYGGALPVQSLCKAGDLMGVGESAVRVALTRLLADGKIERGTRGFYSLNRSGPALSRTVDGWRHRHAQVVPWDHSWIAVHDAGVPRVDKTAYRHHALALTLRGFARFETGLHIRPDNLAGGLSEERLQLEALGLSPGAMVFKLAELDDARLAAASRLWEVRGLADGYRRCDMALKHSEARLPKMDLDAAVRESLLLGRAVIAHLLRDPLLPAELMSPARRIAVVARCARYQQTALDLWRLWLAQANTEPGAAGGLGSRGRAAPRG